MNLLQVPLRDLIEAPRSQRVRDPDEAFISALADSFKSGSDQQTPIPAYLSGGKYHAIGGNHQLAAMKRTFGEESDRPTWIRVLSFDKREETILEAAKDNNHRDMSPNEWQGVFSYAVGLGWTQEKIARWFGFKQPWVSQVLKYDPYAKHRDERANVRKEILSANNRSDLNPPVAPSPSDGQPVPSVSPPPQLGGMSPPPISLIPENPPETGDTGPSSSLSPGSKPALDGSTGGDGAEPTRWRNRSVHSTSKVASPVSEPPLLSPPAPQNPLPALQKAVAALRDALRVSEWEEADDATARAARDTLASAEASIYDFRAYLEDGRRTKEGPLPRPQVFAFPIRAEVRIRSENGGHRAWVLAHLPGGKVKLRILRGKEKSEEIHLERNLVLAGARA